jgi:hypothetical protein
MERERDVFSGATLVAGTLIFVLVMALHPNAHQILASADVGHAAHVNLPDGKAFCFMSGPDEESIRKAHEAINFPYDSITEVRRVTGADMRAPKRADAVKKAG